MLKSEPLTEAAIRIGNSLLALPEVIKCNLCGLSFGPAFDEANRLKYERHVRLGRCAD
jgi:hypothetical protein